MYQLKQHLIQEDETPLTLLWQPQILHSKTFFDKDNGHARPWTYNFFLNEVILLCIFIFTLLLYITINITTIEYNGNVVPHFSNSTPLLLPRRGTTWQ